MTTVQPGASSELDTPLSYSPLARCTWVIWVHKYTDLC